MEENDSGNKYVAKWDKDVVVDVYREGDFWLVVQENGAFQVMSERTVPLFFRPAPELDPEHKQPHCITCGANLLTTPQSVHTPYECVTCRKS